MKLNNFIQFQPNQRLNTNAEIFYFDAICLKPYEWYCQVLDIELADNDINNTNSLQLVDCNNKVLEGLVYFFDGLFCEFIIQNEYFEKVKLKATTPNGVFYSNPFSCFENKLTLRIDYKLNDYFQSIRVAGHFTTVENESEVDVYTESRGGRLSGYSTLTTKQNYTFDNLDNFTVLAINEALAYPTVYINGIRVTDKPVLKGGTIEGSSNFMTSELQGSVDLFDVYGGELQIASRLFLQFAIPQGNYTLTGFNPNWNFTFNHAITLNTNDPIQLFKDDVFIENLVINLIDDIDVYFDAPAFDFVNGTYKIILTENKFTSLFGTHEENIINFVIQNADFDINDFNNDDFLTD